MNKQEGMEKLATWDYLKGLSADPDWHALLVPDIAKFSGDTFNPNERIDIVMVKDGPIREGTITTMSREESHSIIKAKDLDEPAKREYFAAKLRDGYTFHNVERVSSHSREVEPSRGYRKMARDLDAVYGPGTAENTNTRSYETWIPHVQNGDIDQKVYRAGHGQIIPRSHDR